MAKKSEGILPAQLLATYFTSLGMLLGAGVNANQCPAIIAEDTQGSPLAPVAASLASILDGGQVFSLAEAMAQTNKFPSYAVTMMQLGEDSGRMEVAAASLADYYEKQYRLRQSLRSAVSGPALLLAMMTLVQVFLLLFVLPLFDRAFETLGTASGGGMQGAYLTARISVVVSGVLLVLVLALLLLYILPGGQAKIARIADIFPPTRRIRYHIAAGNLAHGLQMLLASGISPPQALAKASTLVSHRGIQSKLLAVLAAVEEGADLGKTLVGQGVFGGFEARVLLSAARSGNTELAMGNLATAYTEEAEAAIDHLLGTIEPALVTLLTLAIGIILLSVMLPLVNIMNAVVKWPAKYTPFAEGIFMKRKKYLQHLLIRAASLVLFLVVLVFIAIGTAGLSGTNSREDIRVTRQAIERAAVLCYATEGFYPPSLSYIEEHYGVQVNHQRYFVRYEVFASNVLPNITIRAR